MPVAPVVLAAALVCGAAAFVASTWGVHDLLDPGAGPDWLVRRLGRRPRLVHFVRRRLDRTTAFGLTLTLLFGVVVANALVVGALFDMVTHRSGFARWDRAVAVWGAHHVTAGEAGVLRAVTALGSTNVIVAVALVTAAIGGRPGRRAGPFVFLATVVVGQLLSSNVVKTIVDRPRPAVARFVATSGSSFPSGHSTAAAATWAAVAFVLGRGRSRRTRGALTAAAVTIAVAVGATRALLGAHWLTDVLAGLALGFGWFLAVAIAMGGRALRAGAPAEQVAHERLRAAPGTRAREPLPPPVTWREYAWRIVLAIGGFVIVGAVTGWALDVMAHRSFGRRDERVNEWFAQHRDATLDRVTSWLSSAGSTPIVVGAAVVAVVALYFLTRTWRGPARLAIGLTIEIASFLAIVSVVDRARPSVSRLDPSPPTSSYPSGHTAASVALYVGLALVVVPFLSRAWQRRLVLGVAIALATAVALARVYRGMHHPTDVLAGGALGSGCVWWARRLVPDAAVVAPEERDDLVLDREPSPGSAPGEPQVHTGRDVAGAR